MYNSFDFKSGRWSVEDSFYYKIQLFIHSCNLHGQCQGFNVIMCQFHSSSSWQIQMLEILQK